MLFVNGDKVRNGNVHLVWAPLQVSLFKLHFGGNACGVLIEFNGLVNWEKNLGESLFASGVRELLFLKLYTMNFVDLAWCQLNRCCY